MECMQFLHMNGGEGETSYAKNSTLQMKIMLAANPMLEEAINDILMSNKNNHQSSSSSLGIESMGIADLGCSSGPNTLTAVSRIIGIICATCKKMRLPLPELQFYLNDLPSNDFNDIFMSLPAFHKALREGKGTKELEHCFVTGVPGSFYGRMFPRNSLHFVHSYSSLHWLSQAPPNLGSVDMINKGKIYISKTTPPSVLNAYLQQFQTDFFLFLKSRSVEMISNGRMVLSFMGRSIADPTTEESCYQWELLAQALAKLVPKGVIEEEKIDCFDAPYYAPSTEEVIKVVDKEGSFVINRLETFEVDLDGVVGIDSSSSSSGPFGHYQTSWDRYEIDNNVMSRGQRVAKTIRAVVESMLSHQFGRNVMDELFTIYGDLVDDYVSKTRAKNINLVISLTRKHTL